MTWGARVFHRLRRLWWRLARPRTRGARVILVDEAGRVCLVRHSYGAGWYLPGCGLHRGEDPASGAIREVREELGVEVVVSDLLGAFTSRAEGKRDTIWVFSATTSGFPRPGSAEVVECDWFELSDLPSGTSPATRRRLEECAGTRKPVPSW